MKRTKQNFFLSVKLIKSIKMSLKAISTTTWFSSIVTINFTHLPHPKRKHYYLIFYSGLSLFVITKKNRMNGLF